MDNFNFENQQPVASSSTISISQVMRQVYVKMFLALVVSAISAYTCVVVEPIRNFLFSSSIIFFGLMIMELVLVIAVSRSIVKSKNATMATLMFYLYSILNGVTLSVVMLLYTASSIVFTFAITAGVFAAMSVYGYFTNNDLSRMGSFLIMAIFGLIICSVVNIFAHSSTMEWIISFAGVAIFIGLTAWDTQKIKLMLINSPERAEHLATFGALSLYLDFINLFLYLLRFFGRNN